MIALIGISKNTPLHIREKFSRDSISQKNALKKLKESFLESVIIGTCNRMEIYILSRDLEDMETITSIVFKALDYSDKLKEYIFFQRDRNAVRHLMELSCGFHSKILGEDQILGQIKNSYILSKEIFKESYELSRLFEMSLNCGKEFKTETKLYKIPVSYSSIAVSIAKKHKVKKIAILGYGDVGKKLKKYIDTMNFEKAFILVRNKEKIKETFNSVKFELCTFKHKKDILKSCDCIFVCTSYDGYLIESEDIVEGKEYIMFDLSLPRNIDIALKDKKNIRLYDIDELSKTDDENKKTRYEVMVKNKYIIKKHIEDFISWMNLRNVAIYIKEMKIRGENLSRQRITYFKNKMHSKDHEALAETTIKSMRDFYVNRAIEVLKSCDESKDETLKIIKKIFIEE